MENKQKQTQQQMILDAFRANGGILTPSDIMKLGIAQYNARIYELKHKGYRITSEYLGTVGGVKRTVFRLELDDVLTSFKTEKSIYETAREISQAKDPQNSFTF